MDLFSSRTALVLGETACNRLKTSRVAVFGVGGVGGFAIEALARAGVGAIDIIDNDTISESNLNRQIIALKSTIGRTKVDVMAERIADINPDCLVTKHQMFFLPETSDKIDFTLFDYVIDAIDTVTGKLEIIRLCKENNVPVISSMGTGNKLDPTAFKVADIKQTKVCPLAKVIRTELKKRGIEGVKVLWSDEIPKHFEDTDVPKTSSTDKKRVPGSVSFVPSVAGLIIAGEVIRDLAKER